MWQSKLKNEEFHFGQDGNEITDIEEPEIKAEQKEGLEAFFKLKCEIRDFLRHIKYLRWSDFKESVDEYTDQFDIY